MKKHFKWLGFFSVLIFYFALYTATSVDKGEYNCDEVCQKIGRVHNLIRRNYDSTSTYQCHTDEVCIAIYDSIFSNDPKELADSACLYLNNEGLHNYTISVIDNQSQDTLLKQTCP